MLASTPPKQYGNASWSEKLALAASLLFHMPLVLAWALLTSPFHPNNAHKSWKRVIVDKLAYFLCEELNTASFQWLLGDTYHTYVGWTKENGLPLLADDLGENTRLLWVGKPRTDRVILYFHGGGFFFPMTKFGAGFWKRTLAELKVRGADVGLVILSYSLEPTAAFPTPLRQAVLALGHLISIGVKPENIQITGDSAGANLALQLISHLLHPLDSISRIELSAPIGGVFLMSPWVSLSGQGGSRISNDNSDIVGRRSLTRWGRWVLDGASDSQRNYIETVNAPESWFGGVEIVVRRVLITAGDAECLRDEIVVFANRFCRDHDEAQFILQKYGVHNDPYFDLFANRPRVGGTSVAIWDWLSVGFKQEL